jgi:hypothetical protein
MNRFVSVRMPGGNVSHKVGDDSLGSPRKPNMKNATKQQPMERTISDKAGESSRTGCLPLGSIHLPPGWLSDVMEILPYSPVILRHPRKALFPGNGNIFFSVSGGYRDRHKAERSFWELGIRKSLQPHFCQRPSLSIPREGLTIKRWTLPFTPRG